MSKTVIILSLASILVVGSGTFTWAGEPQSAQSHQVRQEKNAVLRYFHEALDGRNAAIMLDIFAVDGIQHFPGLPPIVGNQTIAQSMAFLLSQMESFHTNILDIVAEGNRVVAFVEHTMVLKPNALLRTYAGVSPQILNVGDKTITWKAMAYFSFDEEGKIWDEWIARDDVGIYLQAGAVTVTQ